MTYGFRPENWPAFQAELQRRGINSADIEKVEMRPTAAPGDSPEDRPSSTKRSPFDLAARNHGVNLERWPLIFLADLEEFVGDHGPLTADATEPAWNGYLLTVTCTCGVTLERWVTPDQADADFLRLARLN